MVTPRDGSFYPSTYQINHNPSGQWFPSVGSVIASSGLLVPYIGPCLTYPVGYPIHYVEAIAVAPAIDTTLLPVDLCFRPSYLKKEREYEERNQARGMLQKKDFDAVMQDERYFNALGSVQNTEFCSWLQGCAFGSMNSNHVAQLMVRIKDQPELLIGMKGVLRQDSIATEDWLWAWNQIDRLQSQGRHKEACELADMALQSVNVTEETLLNLTRLGYEADKVGVIRQQLPRRREAYERRLRREKEERDRIAREKVRLEQNRIREEAERRKNEELRAKKEAEVLSEALLLSSDAPALYSDQETFERALSLIGRKSLRTAWMQLIRDSPRMIPVKNLELLLEALEGDVSEAGGLRCAVLSRPELEARVLDLAYDRAVAHGDIAALRRILPHDNASDKMSKDAYQNRALVRLRLEAYKYHNPRRRSSRSQEDNPLTLSILELEAKRHKKLIDEAVYWTEIHKVLKKGQPRNVPPYWWRYLYCYPDSPVPLEW